MSNGKGDAPRPIIVDREVYENNWERTFGKKNCEYSGLPAVTSYEETPNVHSKEERKN